MKYFCDNCGEKSDENQQFCTNCGTNFSLVENEIVKNLSQIDTSPKVIKKQIIVPIILIIILVLVSFTYLGVKKYNIYQENKIQKEKILFEKEKAREEIDSAQQKKLENALNEINQLKDKNIEIQKNQKTIARDLSSVSLSTTNNSLPSIVKKWSPIVGFIYCNFKYTNGVIYQEQTGSGSLILYSDGSRAVLTNKHVIIDEEGYGPAECLIKFPEDDTIFKADTFSSPSNKNTDVVYLEINNPDIYLTNIKSEGRAYCLKEPELGDEVAILGYPGIGSHTDITVTEGIISGNDGDYYITSAKVEHGNSGGAAIDLKNNCYIGIPTYAETGTVESLARILKWQSF